jgi:hypothetical protein
MSVLLLTVLRLPLLPQERAGYEDKIAALEAKCSELRVSHGTAAWVLVLATPS